VYIVFLGIWHYDYKELIAISYVGADIPASLCPKSSYRLSSTAKDSTCVRSSSPTSVSEDEEESDPLRRRRGEGKESSDLLAYRNCVSPSSAPAEHISIQLVLTTKSR
jgi:hypothetical protein